MVDYAAFARPLPPGGVYLNERGFLVDIPVTDHVKRRPVFNRYLRRKHYMLPLEPPTEDEKRDAIRILSETWEDELTEEALRILDEAGDGSLSE
jgi:hypothetical protein